MAFYLRMQRARRRAGLSQLELGVHVGVSRSAVSQWEMPHHKVPSIEHLQRTAEITHVRFEWLASGRGQMELEPGAVLDSVETAAALLVEDDLELRLLRAFRDAPPQARVPLVEVLEVLASQRTGRGRRLDVVADDALATGG
jgi:transcriptional regulator with XRE-family HTH domain